MKLNKLPVYYSSLYRTMGTYENPSNPKFVNKAQSGPDNFRKDFEKSHIKTNAFQKILLGLGSGVISITSPSRGDMIAVMGEITGCSALQYMQSKMNESEEGRQILEEKPRISSGSIDLDKLKSYSDDTLGKAYSNFLDKYGYSPDTRNAVQFVDDIELAYVAQRYRETHDLIHTLLDMPTNMLGEVTVKWVEAIQFKLPMCATGALFGAVRLAPKFTRTYSTKSIIKLDSELIENIESKIVRPKKHPGIMHLPRVSLPDDILRTIRELVVEANKTTLTREAEAFRKYLFHRVLPMEEIYKKSLIKEIREYYKAKLGEDVEEDEKIKDEINRKVYRKLKSIINHWKPIIYDKRTCFQYLLARAPADYAVLKKVFGEIHKRENEFAPKTLLDFGSGIGTVNWAAHEIWSNSLKEYYCVDASGHMNELASLILRGNNADSEPFIKTVYFRQFFPATPRLFDIVVSSYSFFEFSSCEQRMRMLTALWNDTKEYLVLIENGSNWGFQIINEARDFLLKISEDQGVDCYVFAPCPHDEACPRRFAEGKRTPCNFSIQYQKISLGKSDDTATETFCYLVLRKQPRPDKNDRPCRIVRNVIKRKKLAVCKLCTNEGKLVDLFVTSSKHGKHAYKCMRASHWGDLVPGKLEAVKMLQAPSVPLISNLDVGETIPDSDSESESESNSKPDYNNTETRVTDDKKQRKKYVSTHLPWAIETGYNSGFLMNVYFEKRWEQTVSDLYRELRIKPVPFEERIFSKVTL